MKSQVFFWLTISAVLTPLGVKADLVNIGDSQTITLQAALNGSPTVNRSWGVPIQVTAGTYHFHLENSYWDFGIYGWRNEVVGGVQIYDTNLNLLAYDPMAEGTNPNATLRDLDFDVPVDQTLLAGVADNEIWDNAGEAIFTLKKVAEAAPPSIRVHPQSQTVSPGASVVFQVEASGKTPMGFQWRLGQVNIPGATNTELTVPIVSATTVGSYDVVLTNAFGTSVSEPARLAMAEVRMLAAVLLDGPIGSMYRIDCTESLTPPNWMPLTNVVIPVEPFIFVDYDSPACTKRFYRAVPLP